MHSPYGSCVGKHATRACAWVYGNSIGRDDVHRGVTGSVGTWWIDVEQDNTWSSSTARNRAVVEGMVAGLKAAKKRVGIYALSNQFSDILGTVPASSTITKLPSWVAGAKDENAALQRCNGASLTKGRLTLVQWVDFSEPRRPRRRVRHAHAAEAEGLRHRPGRAQAHGEDRHLGSGRRAPHLPLDARRHAHRQGDAPHLHAEGGGRAPPHRRHRDRHRGRLQQGRAAERHAPHRLLSRSERR